LGAAKAGRGHIPERVDIDQRPAIMDKKERFGDLEIDLIIGAGHNGALLTINDRATGMLKMWHIANKEAKTVEDGAIDLLEEWMP
jgi:IS30 family transposase